MLEYLVTSATRRRLLLALWRDRARGTASSLARRAGVPFGAAYGELKAMARAGAAREALESGRVVYEAHAQSPYAEALSQLAAAVPAHGEAGADEQHAAENTVRSELAAQGAALQQRPAPDTPALPLEELLARACELSHRDPSVAKALPYLFARKKEQLSFERLERALLEHKQKHTAGFFIALAGALTDDKILTAWSKQLKDKRRTRRTDLFSAAAASALEPLAGRSAPSAARAWGYRLNLSMDDFRNVLDELAAEEPERTRTKRRRPARRHAGKHRR